MEPWAFWVILAAVLGVGEIITTSLVLAPFAGGALLAAGLAGLGMPLAGTLAAFIVVSMLLLMLLRPIARRHRNQGPALRTGMDALLGQTAIVLETVDGPGDAGTVKLAGETWTARPFDEELVIPAGRRVQVVEIRGATALVSE